MKLLTRQDVIDIWSKQSKEIKNSFVCPNCRDLLYDTDNTNELVCLNEECSHCRMPVTISIEEIIKEEV